MSDDVLEDVVRIVGIEYDTSRNEDPYAKVHAHDGTVYTAWDAMHDYVERHEDDLKGSWVAVRYTEHGDHKHVETFHKPDPERIPDIDPVQALDRTERIHMSAMYRAAATVVERSGDGPEHLGHTASRIDELARELDKKFKAWAEERVEQ